MEKETWALLGAAAAVAAPLIFNTVKEAVWETKKKKKRRASHSHTAYFFA
ncbi:hypothetical protein LD112_20475 [Pantoea agglomerans]|nr:hypothetical protein [Pantoea agglomerans]